MIHPASNMDLISPASTDINTSQVEQQSGTIVSIPTLADVPLASDNKTFPGLNDDLPIEVKWHSKSSRNFMTEIRPENCIFLRLNTGEVQVYERDAFKDRYAEVVSRSRVVGPDGSVDVVLTSNGGVIVLEAQVKFFDTKQKAEIAGYKV